MEKTRSIAQCLTTLYFCPSHFLFIISIGMWRLDVLLGWYSVHASLRYATFLIPLPASSATSFYFHVINHTSVHLPVLCGDLLNDVTSLFCIAHFKECSMILSIPNQRFPIKSYCIKTWPTKCRWTVIISSSSSCLVSTPIYLHPIPTGFSLCKVGQTIFIIISWFFLNRQSLNENPKK